MLRGTPMSDYKPIPVEDAKALAERYQKSIVIIFAWDPAHGLIHTTTYGFSEQDKDWAAKGGEIATAALGGVVPAKIDFEDYRITRIKKLEAENKQLREVERIAWNVVNDTESWPNWVPSLRKALRGEA